MYLSPGLRGTKLFGELDYPECPVVRAASASVFRLCLILDRALLSGANHRVVEKEGNILLGFFSIPTRTENKLDVLTGSTKASGT
jgi:hypothetical protein